MPVRPVLVVMALGALSAGCGSSSGPGGVVPINEVAAGTASGTEAGPATEAPAPTGTIDTVVVAEVEELLDAQAVISRPVGDDGLQPLVADDRVFILGDSIADSAGPRHYDTIRLQLSPLGWDPIIDARGGRTTPEGLAVLEDRRAEIHDAVVVLLGHNDATDAGAYRARVEAIVDELADVPLVLLLTNYEFEAGRARMNDELRVVDALHDNVQLVDWNAVVKATSGVLGPDGLHLTERGAQALAATIAVSLGISPDGPG